MSGVSRDQLLAQTRAVVPELDPQGAHDRLEANPDAILLDVREADEVATGLIPGARHVPRGFLELRIEDVTRDRARELIVYCAGGTRSVLAAKTLQDMGYAEVSSMSGGFSAWKAHGLPWVVEKQLTPEQKIRYSRHILLPEVGEAGQKRLLDARVLLVGAGGLGSPIGLYLAAAGVGTVGVVDPDLVDTSNLQRQIIHRSDDAGGRKVDSAERAMRDLNPDVQVVKYPERLTAANIDRILDDGWELVVDGCDNFATRYLINDACVFRKLPNVHGSIYRFEGQAAVFAPHLGGPCYRCLYPEPPPPGAAPSCAEAGVIGALPGLIGTVQATETLKLLLGVGRPLIGRLSQLDALDMSWRELKIHRDPRCPVCGEAPTITTLVDYEAFCGVTA
ncbi:MAG: molybdopterin-synthase adenylyltransferase MoeB [Deltaproteobacteria bacterium]|nr:molybdopterin-synthase adenylyltransferase MoeB [Deltaproteobacteria bacterium]